MFAAKNWLRSAAPYLALAASLGHLPASHSAEPPRSPVPTARPVVGAAPRAATPAPRGIGTQPASVQQPRGPQALAQQALASNPAPTAAAPERVGYLPPKPRAAAPNSIVPASYAASEEMVVEGAYDSASVPYSDSPWSPIWAGVEYLMLWEKGLDMPALVSSSAAGTDFNDAAVLGADSTSVLLGGSQGFDDDSLSGLRVSFGGWLDVGQTLGLGGRLMGTEQKSRAFATDSEETPILGRPFFNAFTDEEDALLLGFPDQISGDVHATSESEIQGAEVFLRQLRRGGCNFRCDLIYGYRYLGIDESLQVNNNLDFIDDTAPSFGTRISQQDRFEMENNFHGGNIGLMGHSRDGRWSLDFLTSIALGTMNQRAHVSGFTRTTPASGAAVDTEGGLLTQTSNIGTFEDDPFTVVPEGTVNIGYTLTQRLEFTFGYTFLYASNVARVQDVVDRQVNLTQQTGDLDGPARPAFEMKDASYWIQGLSFGLNLRY